MMRILHTADWHLNDRLGRIDRTEDLRKAVERIGQYCRDEKIDVLVVAGDLFSELARPEALRETIRHWQDVFTEFLATGGTILATTGNHDNENFCQTLRHAMTLAAPTLGQPGELVPPGRLYLAADPAFFRLPCRSSGQEVQFVMMPYPTPTHYLRGEPGQKYASPHEKNRLLTEAFTQRLTDIEADPRYRRDLPSVLAAHVHVHGGSIGKYSLFRLSEQDDIIVEGTALAERFAYVALGHIHKPQTLGAENIRYSGSIEKMDLGETNDSKGVVIVDLGRTGQLREITTLPLPSTPVYEIMVRDPAEDIPRLRQDYPEAHDDLVNLHITYTAGKHILEDVLRELEGIFPRWYARDWQEQHQLLAVSLADGAFDRSKSFAETVREYLQQELVQHPDAERDAILALAEELISECDETEQ